MLNPLSLEAFTLWLEKQDPNAYYDFGDPLNCLCHQYLKAAGFPVVGVVHNSWDDTDDNDHPLPEHWNEIAHGAVDIGRRRASKRWTFGAALARAKAILAKEQVVA